MKQTPGATLPDFVAPMLAVPGAPFDSPQHLFEIKWDGTRCIALHDASGLRLRNRRAAALEQRYPELSGLARLEKGCVLDGEIVVTKDGKPDFAALQQRDHTRNARDALEQSRLAPATYVVFDVLYRRYASTSALPLHQRRSRLEELVASLDHPRIVLSQGVVGQGRRMFEEVCGKELEGVIAKRLDSPYLSGKRSPHWVKIKRALEVLCVVIGYLPKGRKDWQSLVIATQRDGGLCLAGRVGSGLDEDARERLLERMRALRCDRPLIPCSERATWIKPEIYCRVRAMEWTHQGRLRAPVLIEVLPG